MQGMFGASVSELYLLIKLLKAAGWAENELRTWNCKLHTAICAKNAVKLFPLG